MKLCFQRIQYKFWRWGNKKKREENTGSNQGKLEENSQKGTLPFTN